MILQVGELCSQPVGWKWMEGNGDDSKTHFFHGNDLVHRPVGCQPFVNGCLEYQVESWYFPWKSLPTFFQEMVKLLLDDDKPLLSKLLQLVNQPIKKWVKLDFQKFAMKQMKSDEILTGPWWSRLNFLELHFQPRVVSIGWWTKSLHKQCGCFRT